MKKVTEAALTAGLVAALHLTGCGEKRATDTNDNRPDVVQQGKQAGEDAAKGAKDMLDDGANAAKKMIPERIPSTAPERTTKNLHTR